MKVDQVASDLGERIFELRQHLGLNQAEMAQLFGREWKQVSQWERGEQKPRPSTLMRAAKAQGWPVEIFQEGGPRPAQTIRPTGEQTLSGLAKLGAGQSDSVSEGRVLAYGVEVTSRTDVQGILKRLEEGNALSDLVVEFATMDVEEYRGRREPMPPERIIWWVSKAFEAGKIAASSPDPLRDDPGKQPAAIQADAVGPNPAARDVHELTKETKRVPGEKERRRMG